MKRKIGVLLLIVSLLAGCSVSVTTYPRYGDLVAYVAIPKRHGSLALTDLGTIGPEDITLLTQTFDPTKYELLHGAKVEVTGNRFRKTDKVKQDGRFYMSSVPVGSVEIRIEHEFLREPFTFEWDVSPGLNDLALVGGAGYFLCIGIDRWDWQGASNDALSMHEVFDVHSTLYGANRILINDQAIKSNIYEYISFVVNDAQRDPDAMNYFVIYYSGPMAKGYIEPWDTGSSWGNAISDTELNEWLKDFPGYVTVILEGHESNSFIDARPLSTSPQQLRKKKYTVITAASENQDAKRYYDGNGKNRGVFTSYLIEGLSTPGHKYRDKADSNGDGSITAREIFNYIKPLVEDYTYRTQTPDLWVGSEHNTVILRYR